MFVFTSILAQQASYSVDTHSSFTLSVGSCPSQRTLCRPIPWCPAPPPPPRPPQSLYNLGGGVPEVHQAASTFTPYLHLGGGGAVGEVCKGNGTIEDVIPPRGGRGRRLLSTLFTPSGLGSPDPLHSVFHPQVGSQRRQTWGSKSPPICRSPATKSTPKTTTRTRTAPGGGIPLC